MRHAQSPPSTSVLRVLLAGAGDGVIRSHIMMYIAARSSCHLPLIDGEMLLVRLNKENQKNQTYLMSVILAVLP